MKEIVIDGKYVFRITKQSKDSYPYEDRSGMPSGSLRVTTLQGHFAKDPGKKFTMSIQSHDK